MATENALVKAGFDLSELTPEEQAQLTELYQQEFEVSREGVDLQPVRFKINKDSCTFTDPFGNGHAELRGVIVYKHKVRGLWNRESENKIPECSSWDGKNGLATETNENRTCATCPMNAWGSGTDEAGNRTRGKACKEMRRLFVVLEGYHLPVMVSITPTSLKNFDSYISARLTRGIPDIAAETVITLSLETGGRFPYAVAQFKMGERIAPKRMLELSKMRTGIEAAAAKIGIENEDYPMDDGNGAAAATEDDDEPF